jgi:hypothetical protein
VLKVELELGKHQHAAQRRQQVSLQYSCTPRHARNCLAILMYSCSQLSLQYSCTPRHARNCLAILMYSCSQLSCNTHVLMLATVLQYSCTHARNCLAILRGVSRARRHRETSDMTRIIVSTYFDPPQKFSKNVSCTFSSSSGTNSKTPTASFQPAAARRLGTHSIACRNREKRFEP